MKALKKQMNARARARRVRSRIPNRGSKIRISLAVSAAGVFAQFIDDAKGTTVLSGRDHALSGTKTERVAALGAQLGAQAKEAGITTAVLDRGAKRYHGRVKAFADALRSAGVSI